MAYEDLLKSVEESAAEQERELRGKAAAAIEQVRMRGQKQADIIRETYIGDAKRSITAERNKAIYLVNSENKEQMIRIREIAFGKAFDRAHAYLAELRKSPRYPQIFANLLKEAAVTTGGQAFEIHCDQRDESLCRQTADTLGIRGEIHADLETAGGVVLNLPGDAVVISNTVESRLRQAQELRRRGIHAILSGD